MSKRSASRRRQAAGAARLLIYEDEAQRIARFARAWPDRETGGDLFGHWTHSGAPVVSYIIGPGRGAQHNVTSFYQQVDWLHEAGVSLYDRHGLQHVGEWHSHHRLGLNEPSAGDVRTVRNGMKARNWDRFVLMIATLDPQPDSPVLQNYYLFSRGGDYRPLAVAALPGASPFRSGPQDPHEEALRDAVRPERKSWMLVPAPAPHRPHPDGTWRPGPHTPASGALEEPCAGAWFTTETGKALVKQIFADLDRNRIACSVRTTADGRGLTLTLPAARIVLGPAFPQEPPTVIAPANITAPPWSPENNLVTWYRSLTQ